MSAMRKKKPSQNTIRVFQEVPLDLHLDRLPPGEVNVEDAARFLQVSDETIRRHIVEGRIKARREHDVHGRSGWRWVVPTSEVNRLRRLATRVIRTRLPSA